MESMMELKLEDILPRGRCGELAPLPPNGRPPPPPLDKVGVTVSFTAGGPANKGRTPARPTGSTKAEDDC
jgi:hypothetical protein